MKTKKKQMFVAVLTVNAVSKPQGRKALLERFVANGLGADVNVIDHAVLRTGNYRFIIIAEARTRAILKDALSPATGTYDINIAKVADFIQNLSTAKKFYAVLVWDNQRNKNFFIRDSEALLANVHEKVHVKLKSRKICSSILFVEAPTLKEACKYGNLAYPQGLVYGVESVEISTYLQEKIAPQSDNIAPSVSEANTTILESVVATNLANSGDTYLYNEDTVPAYIANASDLNYYNWFQNRTEALPNTPVLFNNDVAVWSALQGDFNFTIQTYTDPYQDRPPLVPTTLNTNAPNPIFFTQPVSGTTLGFNISTKSDFHARTPLYLWLNDLLNTTKYDAPWPEQNYTGDNAKAYQYFLQNIDGNTPPNLGTVPPSIITAIMDSPGYPPNADFSEESFKFVGAHLIDVCTYAQIASNWFGVNGILSVINTQIANVSTNDLIQAAALMQIPSNSILMMILDEVFSVISDIASLIPEVGTAISVVINISWSTAKFIIGIEKTNSPLEASVANMADLLNQYLQVVVSATSHQLNTLVGKDGNWGKLSEFASNVITGKLSPDKFGMEISGGDNSPKVPQGYITAAANAWQIIIYQSLFAINHTPQIEMMITESIPNNPWNPATDNYEFVYYLNCNYNSMSCHQWQTKDAYMEFNCITSAPNEVMQVLFGPNSQLNINPLSFFMGFNGWTPIVPNFVVSIPMYPTTVNSVGIK